MLQVHNNAMLKASKPLYIQWIVGDVFYKIKLILWV